MRHSAALAPELLTGITPFPTTSLSGNLNEAVCPSARGIQQNGKDAPQAQVCPGGDLYITLSPTKHVIRNALSDMPPSDGATRRNGNNNIHIKMIINTLL